MTIMYDLRVSVGFTQLVICMSAFTSIFIYGLIVPVLPFALAERIGLPENQVQRWNSILFGAYGVSISLGSVFFGWIGDRFPSRTGPFVFGSLMLMASTVLFALARTVELLLMARVLQGASGALSGTIGGALLLDKVGAGSIGQAQGWISLSVCVAFFVGPIAGGVLYQYAGWFAVYVPALVLVLIGLLLRWAVIEGDPLAFKKDLEDNGETRGLLEHAYSSPLPTATHGRLVPDELYDQEQQEIVVDSDIQDAAASATKKRKNGQSPLLVLLSIPRIWVSLLAILVVNSFSGAVESVLPLYCKELFDISPSQASLIFVPLTIPCLFAPVAGALVDRIGPKWPGVAAYITGAITFVIMALVVHGNHVDAAILSFSLLCLGFVLMLAYPAMLTDVVRAVKEAESKEPAIFGRNGVHSLMYGLTLGTDSLGMAVGSAYAGFLREAITWSGLCFFMAGLSGVIVVLAILTTGGSVKFGRAQEEVGCPSQASCEDDEENVVDTRR